MTKRSVVWGQAAKVHLNKIPKLQKRVLRLMNFGQYTTHAIPFFISAKVLPIDLLYFKSVAILMHDQALRWCNFAQLA